MPSPNPVQPPNTSPTPQDNLSDDSSYRGLPQTKENGIHNGVQQKGPAAGSPCGEEMQQKKEKAKAVMAASGLPTTHDGDGSTSSQNAGDASEQDRTPNDTVPTRKRSRSGTRIIQPKRLAHEARKRGPDDEADSDGNSKAFPKVKVQQYLNRDNLHTHSMQFDLKEMANIHQHKREVSEDYMKLRGLKPDEVKSPQKPDVGLPVPPLLDPSATFGHGYGRYGKFGNGTTQATKTSVILPFQRKRAGGMRTKELRVPKKELGNQAEQLDELVPIRLDIEWNKIRLRDTFTWNLHDRVVSPDLFAQQLVEDLKLPLEDCGPLIQQISSTLQEQIQDYYPHVFVQDEALDQHLPYHAYKDDEMRITIKLNITIGQHTLVDQFEWEINNPSNSPEVFARQMTRDLSLAGEFTTAIAHSIREQSQLFTRSLYVTGHPFDGRLVEDQELKASFLPSPMQSPFRPYQAAKEFTPYLYELNEAELEKTELSLSREERRQKRSVNRRGGPALPDLKDRRRTIRTLVVSSVLPGGAETLEDSRIFKHITTSSKGRRSGYGHKDGIDDSEESDSEDSAPDSPAIPSHLLAGTARTRGMRGAATVAQAAMRGALGRSATPESSNLHHHETRTSGRRFGGKDYREESVDESTTTLIVKLRIPRSRYRQFMHDQKARNNRPTPLEPPSHRRSLSATPGQGTPAPGSMGPPTTPSTQQQNPPRQQGSPEEQKDGANSFHPHAAQIGRVDALGPPSQDHPMVNPNFFF